MVVLAALLTQGYMELFAGYCKGHGLLLTVLLGWCAAVVGEECEGRRPGWSLFLLGVALLAHRTALLLVPAQAWLAWRGYAVPSARAGDGTPRRARARVAAAAFVGVAAALRALVVAREPRDAAGDDALVLLVVAGVVAALLGLGALVLAVAALGR